MAARVPPNFRRVITAAAGGNVIEWYDFYIFGSLAAVLSVKFFEPSHPVAALLSTIALFTAGFLIRPLGAFVFGWMGDRIGRKYTFLVTLTGMALGTGAIGLIPTFQSIGLAAAVILFCLRIVQGLCLGGQYGGAITYVAEHVSDERMTLTNSASVRPSGRPPYLSELLLAVGMDIDIQTGVEASYPGYTPLHFAARFNQFAMVAYLVGQGRTEGVR